MTFPINTVDGRGLSKAAHCELLSKQTKVMLHFPFISQEEPFYQLYYTNKTECFSFKSGHAMWVEKLIKQ